MVNEDILGGLISALSRGESLKRAMISLYNAGYKKEEIEEAARKLQNVSAQPQQEWRPQPIWAMRNKKPEPKKTLPMFRKIKRKKHQIQEPQQKEQPQEKPKEVSQPKPKQTVSKYEKKEDGGKLITIILVTLLLIFVGLLATVVIFREEVIEMFSNLLGNA